MAKRTINIQYKVNSQELKNAIKLLKELDRVVINLEKKGIKIKISHGKERN